MNAAELIIEKFGGQSSLAKLLAKGQPTINYWTKTGVIPAKWRPKILQLAIEQGIPLFSEEFDLSSKGEDKAGNKQTLKATHQGDLTLNGFSLSSAVLEDGTRVLVNRSLATAFGIKGSGSYWQRKKRDEKGAMLPEYLSAKYLAPFIDKDLYTKFSNPIPYINKQGLETEGIPAQYLADICDIFIEAGKKGALKNNPEISQNAYSILLAFSKVGIIALVDEATGYLNDKNRAKDELQKFLKQFMREDAAKWVRRFEDSFFEMIYKMRGWTWNYTHRHPGVVGLWINDIVYERIAPLVLTELQDKNPMTAKGFRKRKHHVYLSEEVGIPKLLNHLAAVEALGRASGYNWNAFMSLVDKAFPKQYQQLSLIFDDPLKLPEGDDSGK